ncbi:MAG: DoxX family protein [Patescibacteria group bacterium]
MFPLLLIYGNFFIFLLRVILGVILIPHGWSKLKDLKGTAHWMGSVGFKPGNLWAPIVGLLEFVGGIFLILGFFVQFITPLLVIQFISIIIWKIRNKQKLVGGYELDLIILGVSLLLLTVDTDVNIVNLPFYFGLFN